MQTKDIALASAQIKMSDDGHEFEGYASVFGGIDSYKDSVLPGAYAETLKNRERPIRMRWNHYGPVIGKWLEIKEDDTGLFVRGELTPGHTVAENVYASMKHQAIDGLSIGYRVKSERSEDGIRYLKELELIEISPVEEPADLGARVGQVKFMQEMIAAAESIKEIETILREAGGFSKLDAVAVVARIKQLSLGEQEKRTCGDDELAAQIMGLNI